MGSGPRGTRGRKQVKADTDGARMKPPSPLLGPRINGSPSHEGLEAGEGNSGWQKDRDGRLAEQPGRTVGHPSDVPDST